MPFDSADGARLVETLDGVLENSGKQLVRTFARPRRRALGTPAHRAQRLTFVARIREVRWIVEVRAKSWCPAVRRCGIVVAASLTTLLCTLEIICGPLAVKDTMYDASMLTALIYPRTA